MARSRNSGYDSGKAFEECVKDSGDYIGKITHSPVLSWRVLDSVSYGKTRKFNQEALCDHIIIWGGISLYLEAKTSASLTSYEMRYIRDSQMDTMYNIWNAGGRSFFLFGRKDENMEVVEVWAVPASLVRAWSLSGKKSIKWAVMDEHGIKIEQFEKKRINAKTRWDLRPLFE